MTDARTNLLDSLRFASDPRAHGVNIVFGGNVIAGTRAKKERSKSYDAFSSINFPNVAVIRDGRIVFYIDDKDRMTEPVRFYHELNERILLLKLVPGTDAAVLNRLFPYYDGDHRGIWCGRASGVWGGSFLSGDTPVEGCGKAGADGYPGHP